MSNNPHDRNSGKPRTFALVAKSGTGKTTLLKKLLSHMRDHGLKVAVIKHSHHNIEVDKPQKDSYQLRKAGAEHMIIVSPQRMAHVQEFVHPHTPIALEEVLDRLPNDLDAILIEGYKNASVSKIELHRSTLGPAHLYANDPEIVAIISDTVQQTQEQIKHSQSAQIASDEAAHPSLPNVRVLDADNVAAIADFIMLHPR